MSYKVLKPFYKKKYLEPEKRGDKPTSETMFAVGSMVERKDLPLQFKREGLKTVECSVEESVSLLIERGVVKFVSGAMPPKEEVVLTPNQEDIDIEPEDVQENADAELDAEVTTEEVDVESKPAKKKKTAKKKAE